GRYDMVCPATTAWELHRRWPEASFRVVPRAGHSALEPGMTDALVRATDELREGPAADPPSPLDSFPRPAAKR
ncbi:MAG TPA: hypothetical protein VFR37_17255, partial [Longimicrobium sp.]|nr:hypothetical protein [Longimicrobium sp.]